MSASPVVLQQQLPTHQFPSKAIPEVPPSSTNLRPINTEDRNMAHEEGTNGDHRAVDGNTKSNGSAAPEGQPPKTYTFPDDKLKRVMDDSTKEPLLLVACGSFSPITYLHLRMFEMVADHVKFNTNFEVVGGYLSPVSDAYKKKGLASADHRIHMCQIGSQPAPWLMVDPWEASFEEYTRTALVLDHFDHEINGIRKGVATKDGQYKRVRVALLAGADLIGTMSTPGVWSDADLDHILGKYGAFIIERNGTSIDEALAHLQRWKGNIWVIPQLIQNDVSSTKIRSFLDKKMSVNYLIPAPVIKYIEQHGLYEDGSLHQRQNSGSSAPSAEVNSDAQSHN